MRTAILLLSVVSLLSACSESADSTAPRSQATKAAGAAPTAQASETNANAAGKPTAGPTVTILTSPVAVIDGITFTSNVAWITCPAGATVVGGGYEFTSGAMNSRVAYNGPLGTNIWKVVVYGEGASKATFRTFGTCIS
jgi:hypothetical protein